MNVIDLFSGIGGFSLGLERAGMETVAFCEIDESCHKILNKHFNGVPIHKDIRDFTGIEADVVCGGFPCQDVSIAGKQKGIKKGTRSGLWFEFKRIIKEVKPKYAIIENVERLRSNGLVRVLNDLREIGYDAEWHTIPASAVGAPHKRERIWIIAYPSGNFSERILNPEDVIQDNSQWQFPQNIRNWHGWKYWFAKNVFDGNGAENATERNRMDDGISKRVDRVRWLGNSVVPQIPEIIGRAILAL
jgi:DNA (cytosine-5)-methyltransferase 1